jgi:putative ABC transport system substrate-binding protein
MKRREFIAGLGAAAWPLSALAQRPKRTPVVGQLWHAGSAEEEGKYLLALQKGFNDLGYIENQNIAFEYRFPAEQYDRFNDLAAELVRLKVDVLVAVTGPAAIAAKRATSTIPIVFVLVPDPVSSKLVDSLARPGGNVTGFSNIATDLSAKRLEIFKDTIVGMSRVALLLNPSDPEVARRTLEDTQRAASLSNLAIQPVEVRSANDLGRAFSKIATDRLDGVVLPFDGMLFNARSRIAALALEHRLPTIHPNRDTVQSGLLMSYGPNHEAILRGAPSYVDKILKGTRPDELPVQQPTKFELVLNLRTARALGLTVPPTLLARADEVLE